jgi:erythromycin esterase-like protein
MRRREIGDLASIDSLADEAGRRATGLRTVDDLEPLIRMIADKRIVMLGESSHGTREFYEWRRTISEELIVRHGFRLIAVEGDWPACRQIDRYVLGDAGAEATVEATLAHARRWPTWMWANTEIARLANWLKLHNSAMPEDCRAGFYGLDVYSLFESIDEVLSHLDKLNPMLARRARVRYECFGPYRRDERRYARSLLELPEGCEREVADNLRELLRARIASGEEHREAIFDVQQNARIVANAEAYYRTMVHGDDDSWNVRDRHMLETLQILLDRVAPEGKAIVWAHNTHIGDYRATDMLEAGQINLGGLARERWGEDQVALVGFGTYAGQVTASHAWDGPIQTMKVPPGLPGSYEHAFHLASVRLGADAFWLPTRGVASLEPVRGHRAIGVVYDPASERFGNYVPTSLARRYDAFVFFDRTEALEPLGWGFERSEIPETWPRGM